jgi:hypothetical protein
MSRLNAQTIDLQCSDRVDGGTGKKVDSHGIGKHSFLSENEHHTVEPGIAVVAPVQCGR